jgi:hypothetical protein
MIKQLHLDLEMRIPIEMLNSKDLDLNLVIRLPIVIPINNQTFKFLEDIGNDLYELLNENESNQTQTMTNGSTVQRPSSVIVEAAHQSNQSIQMRFPFTQPISIATGRSDLEQLKIDHIHRRFKRKAEHNSFEHRLTIFHSITSTLDK